MADCFLAVGDNNFVDKDHSANIIAYKFILSLDHCYFEIAVDGPLLSSKVSCVVRNVMEFDTKRMVVLGHYFL